jgi:hypothetical protein
MIVNKHIKNTVIWSVIIWAGSYALDTNRF